jgi:pilus assembly protein CpaE
VVPFQAIEQDSVMTIKVSAICTVASDLAALSKLDFTNVGVVFVVHAGSAQTVLGVIQRDQPDVILLDLPVADDLAMQLIENALTEAPGTHMVVVSPDRSVEFLTRAMRSGVREVLPAPISAMLVQQVVKIAQGRHALQSHQGNVVGRVLAFIPSKGGAGATFLATNLAFALSQHAKRVAVIDLNLHFGDAALYLGDGNAVSSVVDLAREAQRLDFTLLESSMLKVNANLRVLAAPESPDGVNAISILGLEKIIELARSCYDFVLLDLSGALDPVAIKALDLADTICLTLQLDMAFVRAAKRMASMFRELGYSANKLSVIVNRYEKRGDIALADVENATQLKVARTLPNSHDACSASINQGVPLLELAPQDRVARALDDWAQELAPLPGQRHSGWLHNLLARSPSS